MLLYPFTICVHKQVEQDYFHVLEQFSVTKAGIHEWIQH